MSHAPHTSAGSSSNEDGVNIKKIVVIGAVSLATFVASAIIARLILNADTAALHARNGGEAEPAKLIGQAEIGIVDTVHFDDDNRLEEWRKAKRKHLTSYGWVNRDKGIIHVPIDQAMDEVIKKSAAEAPK